MLSLINLAFHKDCTNMVLILAKIHKNCEFLNKVHVPAKINRFTVPWALSDWYTLQLKEVETIVCDISSYCGSM